MGTEEKKEKPWLFKKGQSGNPNGRPRKPEIQLFRDALAKVEKEKDLSLLEHAVRKSYGDTNVLIALLKKILPDKMDVGLNLELEDADKKLIQESVREFLRKR